MTLTDPRISVRRSFFSATFDALEEAHAWAQGRSPWARGALLAYLLYAGISSRLSPEYESWFGGITLAFHEMGHLLFLPFGRTLMFLGGTLTQLAVPLICAAYLLLIQRDWFGFAVGLSWLGLSLRNSAIYVDDANRLNLPLVGFGEDVQHDWETLLTEWHVLNSAQDIAAAIDRLAVTTWVFSMMFGGWLVVVMLVSSRARTRPLMAP